MKEYLDGVESWIEKYRYKRESKNDINEFVFEDLYYPLYGDSILTKVRIGQGAFRVLVTDGYSRRCSITGQKTLPVLEAAHIKPFVAADVDSKLC